VSVQHCVRGWSIGRHGTRGTLPSHLRLAKGKRKKSAAGEQRGGVRASCVQSVLVGDGWVWCGVVRERCEGGVLHGANGPSRRLCLVRKRLHIPCISPATGATKKSCLVIRLYASKIRDRPRKGHPTVALCLCETDQTPIVPEKGGVKHQQQVQCRRSTLFASCTRK
jgi:hypothetical protein